MTATTGSVHHRLTYVLTHIPHLPSPPPLGGPDDPSSLSKLSRLLSTPPPVLLALCPALLLPSPPPLPMRQVAKLRAPAASFAPWSSESISVAAVCLLLLKGEMELPRW